MFLAPIIAKAQAPVKAASKNASKNLENACGFVRRDGLNAVEQVKEAVTTQINYFSPTTPIAEATLPKTCAQIIDFRF